MLALIKYLNTNILCSVHMILIHNEIVKSLAAQSVIVSAFSTSRDSNVVCLCVGQHCTIGTQVDTTRMLSRGLF